MSGLFTLSKTVTVSDGVMDSEDLSKGLWILQIAAIVVIPLMAVVYFYLMFRLLESFCSSNSSNNKMTHFSIIGLIRRSNGVVYSFDCKRFYNLFAIDSRQEKPL